MRTAWFDRRMAGHGLRAARGPIAGLLLLCFLSSLGSLRSDLLPNLTPVPLPQMEGKVLALALLAAAAAVFAGWRRAEWPRGRKLLDSVLVGVGLFVVPAVLVAAAAPWISSVMRVVLFSLAPVFAVVFEPYIGRGAGVGIRGGLLGGIAAVAGVLCVFPVEAPRSFAAGGALCAVMVAVACVAVANCYAVRIAAEVPGNSIAPMAAIAGSTAAVGLAAASAMTEQVVWRFDALAPSLAWSAGSGLAGTSAAVLADAEHVCSTHDDAVCAFPADRDRRVDGGVAARGGIARIAGTAADGGRGGMALAGS